MLSTGAWNAMRFNPCFNGSFTSTYQGEKEDFEKWRFNPCFNGSFTSTALLAKTL
jgi:hypothetical protein